MFIYCMQLCIRMDIMSNYILNKLVNLYRLVILIHFSSIVKQEGVCLCKSRSNPFLEPTSPKQFE